MSELINTSFIQHLIKITEDRLSNLPENCQDWKSELEDPFNQFKKLMLTSEFSSINIPGKLPEVEQLKAFNTFERLIKAKISDEGLWNYLTHEIEFENYISNRYIYIGNGQFGEVPLDTKGIVYSLHHKHYLLRKNAVTCDEIESFLGVPHVFIFNSEYDLKRANRFVNQYGYAELLTT